VQQPHKLEVKEGEVGDGFTLPQVKQRTGMIIFAAAAGARRGGGAKGFGVRRASGEKGWEGTKQGWPRTNLVAFQAAEIAFILLLAGSHLQPQSFKTTPPSVKPKKE
jgi:hypothetical protein